MPYIIITNGTVGSGKSALIEKTIWHYKLPRTYSLFLIDDLIESNEHYKEMIDKIILSECTNRTLCESLEERILNPNDDLYQKFGAAYFDTRGKTGGKWCDGISCEELLNQMLSTAIEDSKNMIFETTGTYYVEWLINKLKTEYKIYYAFTILDVCENIQRNKSRLYNQMVKYINNRSENAPRLPNIRDDAIKLAIKQNLTNIWNLIGKKILSGLPDKFRIIVFNNSSNTSDDDLVLYDSEDAHLNDLVTSMERVSKIANIGSRCEYREKHHINAA